MDDKRNYTAFAGDRCIASGSLPSVLKATRKRLDEGEASPILIFENETGHQVDFDLRGTPEEIIERATPPAVRPGPGRPRLGVTSREVSLLPRQWEWLEHQPNGISAALRRLVDEARKRDPGKERARRATEATSRFMTAMAGNRPNYEEASRALFAGDWDRFQQLIADWPEDIRTYLDRLARATGS